MNSREHVARLVAILARSPDTEEIRIETRDFIFLASFDGPEGSPRVGHLRKPPKQAVVDDSKPVTGTFLRAGRPHPA